jgi:two-component system phosphate regulon sensor histidine kinase PhoR
LDIGRERKGAIAIDERFIKGLFPQDHEDVLKDIAGLVALAIKNARVENEMIALDNVRSDFISSFPHELRTPLAVIKEAVSLLLDGTLGEINFQQRKSLKLASDNIERLCRLTEELVELSRIVSAKASAARRRFDVTGLVKKIIGDFGKKAKENRLSFKARLPAKKVNIWGDKDKLGVALSHIVENAIKYNKPGGSVEITLEDAGKAVRISVSDTGAGIARADLDKILDKFHRVTMRARNLPARWGMGLPIANDITQLHGGRIGVESEPGRGSRFTVILPKELRSRKIR